MFDLVIDFLTDLFTDPDVGADIVDHGASINDSFGELDVPDADYDTCSHDHDYSDWGNSANPDDGYNPTFGKKVTLESKISGYKLPADIDKVGGTSNQFKIVTSKGTFIVSGCKHTVKIGSIVYNLPDLSKL